LSSCSCSFIQDKRAESQLSHQDADVTKAADTDKILTVAVENSILEDCEEPRQGVEMSKTKVPPGDDISPCAVVVQEVTAEVDLMKSADFIDEALIPVTQVISDVDLTKSPDPADIIFNAAVHNTITEDVQVPCQDDKWPTERAYAQDQGLPVAAHTHTLLAVHRRCGA